MGSGRPPLAAGEHYLYLQTQFKNISVCVPGYISGGSFAGFANDPNHMIQFVPDGKVGYALYHNTNGTQSTTQYLDLFGYQPSCFMYPKDCVDGVTFSGKYFDSK